MPRRSRRGAVPADPQALTSGDLELSGLLRHIHTRRGEARQRLSEAELGTRRRGAKAAPEALQAIGHGPGTVLTLDRVTPDLVRLTVARPPGFAFEPGQSTRLEIDGVRRRYTIVSAPHEPDLEFFIELVPGGRMSERLRALRPGGRVALSGKAGGGIALDRTAARHLMLATVTGVNPFVSILRDAMHRGRRDLGCVLVHGASYADELGYRAELQRLAAARPDLLTYVPTVSRPADPRNAGWRGATGRADALIDEARSRFGMTAADTAAYACGNPGMVDAAAYRLAALGFAVRTERYD
jgi:ferredoxin-NADP reductase